MKGKLFVGLMFLAVVISVSTLFFAMQPVEASKPAGANNDSLNAPPPPPPHCTPSVITLWIGACGSAGCPSFTQPIYQIITDQYCVTTTSMFCGYSPSCH
ncbi:MAG: hypothetical protein K8L91_24155 [Anaerolineae bacterium]|nr:hypothetical protein [Anaerolineae bacterium]